MNLLDLSKQDLINMYWAQVHKNKSSENVIHNGGNDNDDDTLYDYLKYNGHNANLSYQVSQLSEIISNYHDFYSNIVFEGKIIDLNIENLFGFVMPNNEGFQKTIKFYLKQNYLKSCKIFIGQKVFFKIKKKIVIILLLK